MSVAISRPSGSKSAGIREHAVRCDVFSNRRAREYVVELADVQHRVGSQHQEGDARRDGGSAARLGVTEAFILREWIRHVVARRGNADRRPPVRERAELAAFCRSRETSRRRGRSAPRKELSGRSLARQAPASGLRAATLAGSRISRPVGSTTAVPRPTAAPIDARRRARHRGEGSVIPST